MNANRTTVSLPTVILLTVIAGLLGYQSQANRPANAVATPGAVATVNLELIYEKLVVKQTADERLTGLRQELDDEGQGRRDDLELLRQDLDLHPPGSRQAEKAENDLAAKTYQLQAYLEFATRKFDAAKAKNLREIYEQIKLAAAQVALQEGYTIVMVDDSVVTVPGGITEAETMRQISARRLLHRDSGVDITETVIAFMNR